MKRPALAAVATVLCLATGPAVPPIQGAADARTFSILQSELQRNFQILNKQESPAYFMAYTVHDSRSAILEASIGALQRSDESHNRFATVEVRVGDYFLDNTHPVRGDNRAPSPRVSQVALPLTDEEKPIRLALWRATDRTFKQASEALTRVKTNVAAKVKEEDPAPDFSREDPQTYNGEPASYSLDTKAWEGASAADLRAVRRRSAGVPQRGVALGRGQQPLLRQQRRLAGRDRRSRRPAVHPGRDEGR